MFHKVIKVLPMFKGGIDSSKFPKDAKIGFILVSIQDIIYVISEFLEHQENFCSDGRKEFEVSLHVWVGGRQQNLLMV